MRIAILSLVMLLAAGTADAAADRPDTLVHVVRDGDTLIGICSLHRDRTHHYTLTDLLTDIRRTNGLESNHLRIGQRLRIPVVDVKGHVEVTERVADGAEVRGIYLAAPACGASSVFARVDRFIAVGGNTVVFDAKDIDGGVSYRSEHPLASWGGNRTAPFVPSLPDLLGHFSRRGLHVVARLALFLDGELGRRHPELALQGPDGAPWSERGCVWSDPANPAVREYNLALAVELARAGVDEIQFDYVRYPTNGWHGDWEGDAATTAAKRRRVISDFLAAAREALAPHGVLISADLYGIMAWGRVEDLALTGQHVPTIAALVDVVCPMIYPSHFRPGFEGHANPGDDPAHFIGEGTRRFRELVAGAAEIRPWLQAFPYLVSDYDGEYVGVQVSAARAAGGAGWCLWNPSSRYDLALGVLPGLCDDPVFATAGAAAAVVADRTPRATVTRPVEPAIPAAMTSSLMGAMVTRAPVEGPTR